MAGKLQNDLTGRKFNRLTVIQRVERTPGDRQSVRWECECTCGTIKVVVGSSLTGGKTQSCGCLAREINSARNIAENTAKGVYDDMTGERYGRLVILELFRKQNGKRFRLHFRCLCDCEMKSKSK